MVTPQIELLQSGGQITPKASTEGSLAIAIIGNAVHHKGIKTLVEVIGVSKNLPLEFHILELLMI